MSKVLNSSETIGIIGAGQLGKMLGFSAQKMGYRVAMFDPNPASCGFAVSNSYRVAKFDDEKALLEFVSSVDAVTYEFENINATTLEKVAKNSNFPQGTKLLLISQDRVKEKTWLNEIGIKTANFNEISNFNELKSFKYPAILKTNRFGYDGKGQVLISSLDELELKKSEILELLESMKALNTNCIIESFCEFESEISVIVARDIYNNIEIFPISKNVHKNGILFTSLVGLEYSEEISSQVREIATKIAKAGELVGVCGVEMFLTKNGTIIANEVAPRPHNSGHYSIEACSFSQFDEHILAVSGQKLAKTRLLEKALMINILGSHLELLPKFREFYPNAMVHIYDKGEPKRHRKMGHITITSNDIGELEEILNSSMMQIWQEKFN
ncbi:MAG: 5-(carboxyamino)imidazole ribonucleotide synthase [Campylobacteraceae bacterium]|nr:5-(carboxyamino)imidazole ribonucleotide synthase [Campylobacteraceae bacterium]